MWPRGAAHSYRRAAGGAPAAVGATAPMIRPELSAGERLMALSAKAYRAEMCRLLEPSASQRSSCCITRAWAFDSRFTNSPQNTPTNDAPLSRVRLSGNRGSRHSRHPVAHVSDHAGQFTARCEAGRGLGLILALNDQDIREIDARRLDVDHHIVPSIDEVGVLFDHEGVRQSPCVADDGFHGTPWLGSPRTGADTLAG
jgi:hypothetical protein